MICLYIYAVEFGIAGRQTLAMIPIQMALGRTVRRLREEGGYSQEAFASTVGVHRTYLGLIERGGVNVTLTTLEKLAIALGVTPSELLLATSEEQSPTR